MNPLDCRISKPVHTLTTSRRLKESERCLRELSGSIEEDWAMASDGHDPEGGMRDRTIHLDRHLHRIQRIAIPINDHVEAVILDKHGGVKFMSS